VIDWLPVQKCSCEQFEHILFVAAVQGWVSYIPFLQTEVQVVAFTAPVQNTSPPGHGRQRESSVELHALNRVPAEQFLSSNVVQASQAIEL
jgi:hypothetical protein